MKLKNLMEMNSKDWKRAAGEINLKSVMSLACLISGGVLVCTIANSYGNVIQQNKTLIKKVEDLDKKTEVLKSLDAAALNNQARLLEFKLNEFIRENSINSLMLKNQLDSFISDRTKKAGDIKSKIEQFNENAGNILAELETLNDTVFNIYELCCEEGAATSES